MGRMVNDPASQLRADPDEQHRAPRRRRRGLGFVLAAVAALALGGWWWWERQGPAPQAPDPIAQGPAASPPQEQGVSGADPRYPLEPAAAPALAGGDLAGALSELLGQAAVTTFLHTDDFARRVVATVDNLGRAHAPPALWPVVPTTGRFSVQQAPEGDAIATQNAQRYAPFVRMVAGVDAARAAAVYRQVYPLLQQSYRELGFGERYFNDRVVEVIDLLLATPEPAAPPRVRLTEVKGPIAPERPWVRYEFADPRLESLSAGQKILLRMGPENARALKQKLAAFRGQIASGAAPSAR